LDRVDGGDLDALEVLNDFKTPEFINEIGAHVFKSNWLGLTCATKVLEGDQSFLINSRNGANTLEGNSSILIRSRKEAGILASLSHPNLVQFFGCGINKNRHDNVGEVQIGQMYLVMELMETSLSSMLKNSREPLPYHVAIDIMHQIAKGVYYLHDMQVAHLDLKPDNVLSSRKSKEDLCCIFKVMDYGTSQLEVCSNPKDPKPSMYTIGTRGYMSPEVIKGSTTPLYPFQADVWSFAMICSEILSRKVPYSDVNPREFYDQISRLQGIGDKSFRPDLPNNCEELTNLIEECWSQDPLQRPTFSQFVIGSQI
jgi:serine/threonine protein kinase